MNLITITLNFSRVVFSKWYLIPVLTLNQHVAEGSSSDPGGLPCPVSLPVRFLVAVCHHRTPETV